MDVKNILTMLLNEQYITLMFVLIYSIKLLTQKKTRDAELRYFWITILCCFFLALQDVLESYTATDPNMRFWRILLSVIGYTLRPIAIVGLLLVVCPPEKRTWKIWTLCVLNALVNLTAFFSPYVFSFDGGYSFTRGPLGYTVFAVGIAYMLQILIVTWKRFYERNIGERWILIICAASCLGASIVDAFFGGHHLNEALLVSAVFFYIFLRAHDNRLDPLTSLLNRFALYEDARTLDRSITAVASLDMNGLKTLNDTYGHLEGDKALTAIGACLNNATDRNTIAYRIGGDEFVMLFLWQGETAVQMTLDRVKADVAEAGYSLAVGFAMREEDEPVEMVLHESDQGMYAEKAQYYQQSGRNRRRS